MKLWPLQKAQRRQAIESFVVNLKLVAPVLLQLPDLPARGTKHPRVRKIPSGPAHSAGVVGTSVEDSKGTGRAGIQADRDTQADIAEVGDN